MPQFALYRNPNSASRARFPLLLDIQSDLLDVLATRVVVPLAAATSREARPIKRLTPLLKFADTEYLVLTPQLAGIPARELGPVIGSLAPHRDAIIAAVDFLITGI